MGKKTKLGNILVEAGVIDEAQLAAALGEQKKWGRPLGMTLVRMGLIEEADLVRSLSEQLDLPMARMRGKRVIPEVLDIVPVELAEKHRCLPLFLKPEGGSQTLFLAMEDPADLGTLDEVSFRIGMKVRPVLVAPSELDEALHRHYHWACAPGDAAPLGSGEAAPEAAGDDDLEPLDFDAAASQPIAVAELEPEPTGSDAEPQPQKASPVQADAILRVLTQLLVEKGVITRAELVERLGALEAEGSEPGS
jgi:type IV pilus assembly protein PilB